ncbi:MULTISPECIES: ABC transporter ATP-binding protein [Cycloclasticus]|jgi:ABC-type nitrate/sulfonate/bicarbonate transport system ATPase subunit|uniref:ABC-type nitrate/sulfonate/bicarbonate transport system, ATPase component n=1 Tax=Cycloclasticus zancles 78-ME TaxID=1198232 RepID=S5T5W7_9GAMM|nr:MULTISPECIES: ATP-binding cassette domain-containing protein [Cycloclasticus]AGS38949.1 ABC-type nitrate/sulfonate/bicarbonate transport system, ATPase component [Cycloclasticus zancles 78-ME]MDF1828975.1 ATP-binding cassette domain-containing protein [Cycloclasticus pugetii]
MSSLTVDIKKKNFPKSGLKETFTVIENLSFDITNNEFVCLVGPSGCGKTTLLNIIAGLDSDYDGTINNQSSKLRPSYVFQTPRLLPWRTVLENIQLATQPDASLASIIKTLQSLNLGDHLHSYPHHLSLGMQRRVSLARAFCLPSNLLLMDEPFVSLDQANANKARGALLNLWHEKPRSILFVTHDLSEAITLADRILFLSAPPSHIIAEVNISLTRTERTPNQVNAFKEHLKTSQPNIRPFL